MTAVKERNVTKAYEILDYERKVVWLDRISLSKATVYEAADDGQEQIVRLLFERGADINYDDTTLHAASKGGHTQVVRLLLEKRAGINTTSKMGAPRCRRLQQTGTRCLSSYCLRRAVTSMLVLELVIVPRCMPLH
jgi:Ankyrin repeats (3 copies)